jgi:Tfp pilus assembly protein PilN
VIRQRGSIELYLIAGVLLLAIGGGLVYTYRSAIVRAERAEADNATLRTVNQEQLAENANLKVAKDRADRLLAERQTVRNTADNIERAVNAKLAEIYRTSEPARVWRDAGVPADVLRGLRLESTGAPGKDGKGTPAGKSAAAINPR